MKTKVAVQRPIGQDCLEFINEVYEVELEPLKASNQSYILKSLQLSNEAYVGSVPFLHKGYFDSHLHVSGISWANECIDLAACQNPVELVAKLETAKLQDLPYLSAFAWDESSWGLGTLSLERVFEGRLPESFPIFAKRICAHSALINQSFKRLVGLPNLPTLVRDQDLVLIESRLPKPSREKIKSWILRAQEKLLHYGVTAVGDMSLDQDHIDALMELAREGKILIDFQGVFDGGRAPVLERLGPCLVKNEIPVGPLGRAAEIQFRHWKKYLDGSFGSRTAWLSQMYSDQDTYGESLQNKEELFHEAKVALQKGFYLSFHVIGDASLDQAIELGRKLKIEMQEHSRMSRLEGCAPSTHRLEHAQLIREDQLHFLKEQKFWTLCLQPGHRIADKKFSLNRLGEERKTKEAYRLGSLLKNQLSFALSSDAPIDDFSSNWVLRAASTDERGDENLTFEEALWFYTTGSRLRLGLRPGVIEVGSTVFLTPQP